jgi:hypothetical protein
LSLNLDVKVARPVLVGAILERSRSALSQLLNVANVPVLEAWQVEQGGTLVALSPEAFLTSDSYVAVDWAARGRGLVQVIAITTEAVPGFISEDEAGLSITVSVMERRALPYALALACAAAIAELCETSVVDEQGFWSSSERSSPDALLQAVSLQRRYADLEEAAEAFMSSIPQGRPQP